MKRYIFSRVFLWIVLLLGLTATGYVLFRVTTPHVLGICEGVTTGCEDSQYVASNSGRGSAKIFAPGTYGAMPAAYAKNGQLQICPIPNGPAYYYDGDFFGDRARNNELPFWHTPSNTAGATWLCSEGGPQPGERYGPNDLYRKANKVTLHDVDLAKFMVNPSVPAGEGGPPALNYNQDINSVTYAGADARAITCPGGQSSPCNAVGGGYSMVVEHDFPMKYDVFGTCGDPNNETHVNNEVIDRERVAGKAGQVCVKGVSLNWTASGWATGWLGGTGYTPYPCTTGPGIADGDICFGGDGDGAPTLESGWSLEFRNKSTNPGVGMNALPYWQFKDPATTETRRSLKFQVISERTANGEARHPGIIYQLTIRYHQVTCDEAGGCPPEFVSCSPASQPASRGQTVTLSATSTNPGASFSWSASTGNPTSGSGKDFNVSFASDGRHTVRVSSGPSTATCYVDVSTIPSGFQAWVKPDNADGAPNEGFSTTGEPNCPGRWYSSPNADVASAPSAFNGRTVRYCWTAPFPAAEDVINPVITTTGTNFAAGGTAQGMSNHNLQEGMTETGKRCVVKTDPSAGKWYWEPVEKKILYTATYERTIYRWVYRQFVNPSNTQTHDVYNDSTPPPSDLFGDDWYRDGLASGYPKDETKPYGPSVTYPPPTHPDDGTFLLDESTVDSTEVTEDCKVRFQGNQYVAYTITLASGTRQFQNNHIEWPVKGGRDSYVYVPASEVSVSKSVSSWFTNPGPAKTHEGIPEIHPGGYANYQINVTSQPDPNLGGRTPSQLHPWAPVSYSLGDSLNQPCLSIVEGPSFRNRSSGGGSGSDPFSGPGQTDSYDLRANGVPDPNPCGDLTRVTNTASASFSSNGFSGSKSGAADVMFRLVFYPWIQAIQGSVHSNAIINMSDIGHAGRGTAPGATYIVSAGGTINAFTSEKNWLFHSDASSPNAFGYVTGGGSYGTVKWPYQEDSLWPGRRIDSAEHVRSYYGAGFNTSVVPGGNGYDLSKGNTKGQVYMVGGGTRMSGLSGYTGKGTIYVRGALYIDGNITRSGSGAARDFTHSLGIVADGPIYIAPGVTQIDALLYSSGTIQTATSRTQNVLTVNGMMVGQRFDLTGRSFVNTACKGGVTGSGSCASAGPAEMYVYMPQLLANTPPGFNNVANVIEGPPRYGGERSPTVGRY